MLAALLNNKKGLFNLTMVVSFAGRQNVKMFFFFIVLFFFSVDILSPLQSFLATKEQKGN